MRMVLLILAALVLPIGHDLEAAKRKPLSSGVPVIAFTDLGNQNTTSGATSYSTAASYSPAADTLVLALVNITDTAPVGDVGTFDGNGTTGWPQILNVSFNNDGSGNLHRLYIFRYMSNAPTAGVGTFNWSAGGLGCAIRVVQFSNTDTSGSGGSGAIVQSLTATNEAAADPAVTLSALDASGRNAVIVLVGDDVNNAADIAPETDWTEIAEVAFNTPATGTAFVYRLATTDNTVTTTATSRDWGIAAVEIKAVP